MILTLEVEFTFYLKMSYPAVTAADVTILSAVPVSKTILEVFKFPIGSMRLETLKYVIHSLI